MKKLSFIITSLLLTFALMITGSPEVHAATTWNTDYIFDANTFTWSGVTVTIEEGTNVFTWNGTATAQTNQNLPDMFTPNSNGSVLDVSKKYVFYYEYISGTTTASQVCVIIISNTSHTDYRSIIPQSNNYTKSQGFLATYSQTTNHHMYSISNGVYTDFKYKLHVMEIENYLADDAPFFTDFTSATKNGITITFTDGNTFVLNGTLSGGLSFNQNVITNVNPLITNAGNPVLITYEYISGTKTSTAQISISPGIIPFNTNNTIHSGGVVGDVYSLSISTGTTGTFTNYTIKLHFQEIELYTESEPDPEPTGLLPSDYGFVISVLGSPVLVDELFEIVQIGETLQLKSIAGTDVLDNGINYINIYTVLTSGTNPISISYGDGLQLFNSTVYERFSGAEGTTVRIDYTFESLAPEITIADLGTSLREVKIYDGVTLLETYTDLSYAMGGTWVAVVIEDIYERTEVSFMNELVEFATESVIEGSLVANPGIPVKAGFVFVGWETTTGHIWDFNNDVATGASLVLTAKYVAEGTALNTISFVTNGGTEVSDLLVEDDAIAVAPTAPTRLGYTFAGWYKDIALTQAFSFVGDTVTSDMILYAKWTPVTGGGDPITDEPAASLNTWVVIGGAAVILIVAMALTDKKKGKRR